MDGEEIRDLMAQARAKGIDPVWLLERRDLLLTDQRRNRLVREAAAQVADMIELMSTSQLRAPGGRTPDTALDMKQAIAAFIRKHFTGEENNGGKRGEHS